MMILSCIRAIIRRSAPLVSAIMLCAAAPAAAGSLQVDPIKIEINANSKIASIRVRNEENAPVTIRAYALTWDQVGGDDQYASTNAIILSPPVFTIPAKGTQLVRVGLRTPAASGRAYRLMIEEVPQPRQGSGVQVALRLNIPVYAGLQSGALSDLSWRAFQESGKGWFVEATNKGPGYVRVEAEEAAAATGVRKVPGFAVVLPGGTRRWFLGPRADIADAAKFQLINRGASPDGRPSTPSPAR